MPLGEALRVGGWSTVITIGLAGALVGFDNIAFAVLSPDIQETLGASDAVMGAIAGAGGVLFLVGSVPISSLADRLPRTRIAAVCVALWSLLIAPPAWSRTPSPCSWPGSRRAGPILELPVTDRPGRRLPHRGPESGVRPVVLLQLGGFILAPLLAGGSLSWSAARRRGGRPSSSSGSWRSLGLRAGPSARAPPRPSGDAGGVGRRAHDATSCRSPSASPSSAYGRSSPSTSSSWAWPASAWPCSASPSSSTCSWRRSSASTPSNGASSPRRPTSPPSSPITIAARNSDRLFRRSPPGG